MSTNDTHENLQARLQRYAAAMEAVTSGIVDPDEQSRELLTWAARVDAGKEMPEAMARVSFSTACTGANIDDFMREDRLADEAKACMLAQLKRLKPVQSDIVPYLGSSDAISDYLTACLATNDEALIQAALADVPRAREKRNLQNCLIFEELLPACRTRGNTDYDRGHRRGCSQTRPSDRTS